MVRVKYRYLLVHILYPDPPEAKANNPSESSKKGPPDLIHFHRPSPNDLTPKLLARTIRDQVLFLYGDYGLGLISGSLHGKPPLSPVHETSLTLSSTILLPRDLHRHSPLLSRTLPTRMGSVILHDTAAEDV